MRDTVPFFRVFFEVFLNNIDYLLISYALLETNAKYPFGTD